MAKETFATRDFNNGDTKIAKGDDLSSLPANQLRDFKMVGLVGPKLDDAPAPAPAPVKA